MSKTTTTTTPFSLLSLHLIVQLTVPVCPAEDRFGRETRTIQVDFTEGQSIYPVVAEQLEGLEVGILGKQTEEANKNLEL